MACVLGSVPFLPAGWRVIREDLEATETTDYEEYVTA